MTQYFDMMKDIGAQSKTNAVFMNHSPGALEDLAQVPCWRGSCVYSSHNLMPTYQTSPVVALVILYATNTMSREFIHSFSALIMLRVDRLCKGASSALYLLLPASLPVTKAWVVKGRWRDIHSMSHPQIATPLGIEMAFSTDLGVPFPCTRLLFFTGMTPPRRGRLLCGASSLVLRIPL